MNNPWFSVIFGVASIYFGIKASQVVPTLLRLLAALGSGAVKWPGPPVYDPGPRASRIRERLGVGYQNLFSTFVWYASVVMAALMYSVSSLIGFSQSLLVPRTGGWGEVLILASIAFVGATLASRKAVGYVTQINTLLSDLASGAEPRLIDRQSGRPEYVMEHPLTRQETPWSDTRALNLFCESVKCDREGNEWRALLLLKEALTIDQSLHKRARENLARMATDCSSIEAGPVYYWLGVHSEYLLDLRQAALWFEKAANAFRQVGYEKRQSMAHCSLGNVKYRMGDASALTEFEKAIALNPRNGAAYFSIATIYYRIAYQGDYRYEQALDAFADAMVADPETYTPVMVASRMRSIDDTWRQDIEDVLQRVTNRQR